MLTLAVPYVFLVHFLIVSSQTAIAVCTSGAFVGIGQKQAGRLRRKCEPQMWKSFFWFFYFALVCI